VSAPLLAGPDLDVVATAAEAAAAPRPPLIVLEPLARFLDEHGIGNGPITAAPIGDGHSNVTYELRRAGARVVVRRPPRPPLPASAHDVLREARVLRALGRAGVRVPEVLAVCEDPAVTGMPFFVMEHLEGHVVGPTLPAALDDLGARAALGHELVDALVELHAVEAAAVGLGDLGRPSGYCARQVRRFAAIWEAQRTRDLVDVESGRAWLERNVPERSAASVVHGDYRLGNVMFESAAPRLRAVLDWELATLGDPLSDLGYLCATWAMPDDEEDNPMFELSRVTRRRGFLTRDELRERYALGSGREVDDLRWYEVLALWKASIFLESSYRRFSDGTTDDPYFAGLRDGVPTLARQALRRAGIG
jgi:aminoglycoside phosphotransferase (APT) family kinase protein